MITIAFLTGFLLAGLVFLYVELRDAPEGFQDETGFHLAWHNNNPNSANVSCIWIGQTEISAFPDSDEQHRRHA